jgi:hypothetical protein
MRPHDWARYSFGPWLNSASQRSHRNELAVAWPTSSRADQQAGYISAASDSTPSLANGSRSIHLGRSVPPTRQSAGCGFRKETIAGMRRNVADVQKTRFPEAAIAERH